MLRTRKDSEGRSEISSVSSGSVSEMGSEELGSEEMGNEVVIRPHKPLTTSIGRYNKFESALEKTGDVAGERFVEERIRQLGLLDTKRGMEQRLAHKLEQHIEQDQLIGALKRCKTARRRPLVDRVTSVTDEITNIIRPSIVTGLAGHRIYKVDILMGLFTKNVSHHVNGHEVVICGEMPSGAKLSKQVTVEFPASVDISQLTVQFLAGVFKLTAPFSRDNTPNKLKTTLDLGLPREKSDLCLDTSLETLDSASSPMTSPQSACSLDSDCSAPQRPHSAAESQRPLDESGFCEELVGSEKNIDL